MKSDKNIGRWLSLVLVTVVILQLLQAVGANNVYANENNSDSVAIKNNNIKGVQGTEDLYYSYPYLREIKYHIAPDAYKKERLNSSYDNSMTIGDYKSVLAQRILENSGTDNENAVHHSAIGGKVWHDINGDGIQEDNETLIEGIDVYLLDRNKNIINSTKTDAFGRYEFDDLYAGTYYVKVNKSDEFKLFTKRQGTGDTNLDNDFDKDGFTSKIEIADKEENFSIDAGMTKPITIGNFVWNDINWNGKQDEGEHGIQGILVKLYKDGKLSLETRTDESGHYLFNNLEPGEYSLKFVDLKDIYAPTIILNSDSSSSNVIDENGFTKIYNLLSGDKKKDIDVAFHKAKIKSNIFEDKNFNGRQDEGESGINDVIVKLYLENGTFVKETRTNNLGIYEFNNLLPGKYYIKVQKTKGYNYFSPKKIGVYAKGSVVNGDGVSDIFNINKGQRYLYLNAGMTFFGEVNARVFEDKNYNGKRDKDDKLIEDTRVKLLSANGDEVKDIYGNSVEDQITDKYGRVYFKNLPKGEYKISVSMPKGYSSFTKQSTDISSNFSNVNTGGFSENINVKNLDKDNVINAGVIKSGSIGSKVWNDNNKDGKQNDNEKGVEGIDVFLCDSNGKLLSVTNTDNDGKYKFDNLDPGKYYVLFETPKNLGVTNLKDNGSQSHKSRDINLSSGEADNSINLGVYVKPDLSKEVKKLPVTSKQGFNDVLGGSALIILGISVLAYKKNRSYRNCKDE